jgi:hypothetical protein
MTVQRPAGASATLTGTGLPHPSPGRAGAGCPPDALDALFVTHGADPSTPDGGRSWDGHLHGHGLGLADVVGGDERAGEHLDHRGPPTRIAVADREVVELVRVRGQVERLLLSSGG